MMKNLSNVFVCLLFLSSCHLHLAPEKSIGEDIDAEYKKYEEKNETPRPIPKPNKDSVYPRGGNLYPRGYVGDWVDL